jgi:hypothetical protein
MKVTTALAIGLAVIEVAVGSMAILLSGPGAEMEEAISAAAASSLLLTFPLSGALLAARLPRNPIGWLLLMTGLGFSGGFGAEVYATQSFASNPQLPGGIWAAWVSQWIFVAWLAGVPLILLLLPNGRLPSPRWRPIPAAIAVLAGFHTFVAAFKPRIESEELIGFVNPLGLEWIGPLADAANAAGSLLGLSFVVAAASVVARVRRAHGMERQQLKWFGYAGGVVGFAALTLLGLELVRPLIGEPLGPVPWIAFVLSFNAIPIAAAIAILRYRLYEIDLLINRTAVYGATSAALAITFFMGIIALQTALRPLTSGSELAVAASTLLSFALFQPIRRQVQHAVDRRFDRSRYDAARMLDAFADRLRDEVDLDALRAELLGAVSTTMAPAHASLWLRQQAK